MKYPLLLRRVQASILDLLVLLISMFGASSLFDRFDTVPDQVTALTMLILFVLYEPMCTTLGATLGQYIIGIRVRKSDHPDKTINFFQAMLRYVLKITLGWLSFITIHFDQQRKAIHDIASGSVMIKL